MRKIGLLVLMVLFIVCLTSCDPLKSFEYYTDGDFVFAYKDYGGGIESLYLYALSDEGYQKKYVVLPKEYKGKEIDGFVAELATFYGGRYYKDDFDSSVLEKIFINFELVYVYDNMFIISEQNSDDGTHSNVSRNKYTFIIWYDFFSRILSDFRFITKRRVFGNNLLHNEDMKKYIDYDVYGIANVSYIYNYEEAPNDGYYWVDDYDNGLIEYIPPEPTRDGYIFDGWYKEKECINKWDFNSDKTSASYTYYEEPDEGSTEEYKEFYNEYISTHTYVETKLYAKWVKN